MTKMQKRGKRATSKQDSMPNKKPVVVPRNLAQQKNDVATSKQKNNTKKYQNGNVKGNVSKKNNKDVAVKSTLKIFKGHAVSDLDVEEEDYEDSDDDDVEDSETDSEEESDDSGSEMGDEPASSFLDRFAEDRESDEDGEESSENSDEDTDEESDSEVDKFTNIAGAVKDESSEEEEEEDSEEDEEDINMSGKALLEKFGEDDESDEEESDEEMEDIYEHVGEKRKLTAVAPAKPHKKRKLTAASKRQVDTSVETDDADSRTLFITHFPPSTTEADITGLSADIKHVRLRTPNGREPFAFVEFESEDVAEACFKQLTGKCLGKQKLLVDYVGEKKASAQKKGRAPAAKPSRKRKQAPSAAVTRPEKKQKLTAAIEYASDPALQKEIQDLEKKYKDPRDRRSLFVTNLPPSVTVKEIKGLSKDIKHVNVRKQSDNTASAGLVLQSEKATEKCFRLLSDKTMGSKKMFVSYVGLKRISDETECYLCKEHGHMARQCPSREWKQNQLTIGNVSANSTKQAMKTIFPSATLIESSQPWASGTTLRTVYVTFKSFDDAKAAYLASQDMEFAVNFSIKPTARIKSGAGQKKKSLKSKEKKNRRGTARKRREKLKRRIQNRA